MNIRDIDQIEDEKEKEYNYNLLNPTKLDDYLGQNSLKEKLRIAIQAAKEDNREFPSLIVGGPSGYGKSTISQIISNEYGTTNRIFICSAIKTKADLMEIFTRAEKHSFTTLDEIHSLDTPLQDCLYSIFDKWCVTIKNGSKILASIPIQPHGIIGCTTSMGDLAEPLRNRFQIIHTLDEYTTEELALLVKANAIKIGMNFESDDLFTNLAKRCRGVPRTINRLLYRIRDYAQVKNSGIVTSDILNASMELEGVDEEGLQFVDYRYVHSIYKNFGCGTVGVVSLASSINESKETLENTVEPLLMRKGLILKTKTGRTLTQAGVDLALKLDRTLQDKR